MRTDCKRKRATVVWLLILLLSGIPVANPVAASVLEIANYGQGSGVVNGTVSCTIDPLGGCTQSVTDGAVTLTATPDWQSIFSGWAGPCSGTAECSFVLATDTQLTANFAPNLQAAIIAGHFGGNEFSTLTAAYAAAVDGNTIAAHPVTFHEDLVLDRAITVYFTGGMGDMYLAHQEGDFTTISGNLDIQKGSVEIDSLIIQ